MLAQIIFLCLSLLLTFLFFFYGFNHYYLINSARKYRSPELKDISEIRPSVSIHLPVYNEKYVIQRLIAACARMAEVYGRDRVKIVIIDDSDDDSTVETDQVIKEYSNKRFQIEALRRNDRQGFKAGALQAALDKTKDDFIAIFDADFIPEPDFLLRTMPYFMQDQELGIIQSRWTHLNRGYNILTNAIAIGIDVHFLIDQPGRYAGGYFQNFNGSGGILRKKALLEAGGWQSDTLSEDLDASYRIQMQGYGFIYLKDLSSPGEIPPTVPSFKKQQGRWACGSLRTARKLLPTLLADRNLSLKKRVQAIIHLTGYMVHPLMFISFLLACLAVLLNVDIFRIPQVSSLLLFKYNFATIRSSSMFILQNLVWVLLGLMILLCTVAVWISPVLTLRTQNFSISKNLSSLLLLFLIGCGISLSNTIEASKALLTNRNWAFKRTPKYAIQHTKEEWRGKRYQVPLDYVFTLELACVCLGGISIGDSVSHMNYGVLLILVPFTIAYGVVCLLTLHQSQPERAS